MFTGVSKWTTVRSLKMYDVLCERLFAASWYIYHVDNNVARFQSKEKLFESFVDFTYYGCKARVTAITLPVFFNLKSPDIIDACWNPHLQPNHITLKNNNYAIILWQGLKTHVSPFLKSFWGTGAVNDFPGLSHFDVQNKTVADLIQCYDKSWLKNSKFDTVIHVVDHLLNSPLRYSPRMCLGLSRLIRDNTENSGLCSFFTIQIFGI